MIELQIGILHRILLEKSRILQWQHSPLRAKKYTLAQINTPLMLQCGASGHICRTRVGWRGLWSWGNFGESSLLVNGLSRLVAGNTHFPDSVSARPSSRSGAASPSRTCLDSALRVNQGQAVGLTSRQRRYRISPVLHPVSRSRRTAGTQTRVASSHCRRTASSLPSAGPLAAVDRDRRVRMPETVNAVPRQYHRRADRVPCLVHRDRPAAWRAEHPGSKLGAG